MRDTNELNNLTEEIDKVISGVAETVELKLSETAERLHEAKESQRDGAAQQTGANYSGQARTIRISFGSWNTFSKGFDFGRLIEAIETAVGAGTDRIDLGSWNTFNEKYDFSQFTARGASVNQGSWNTGVDFNGIGEAIGKATRSGVDIAKQVADQVAKEFGKHRGAKNANFSVSVDDEGHMNINQTNSGARNASTDFDGLRDEIAEELREEIREEIEDELREELKEELKEKMKKKLRDELKAKILAE